VYISSKGFWNPGVRLLSVRNEISNIYKTRIHCIYHQVDSGVRSSDSLMQHKCSEYLIYNKIEYTVYHQMKCSVRVPYSGCITVTGILESGCQIAEFKSLNIYKTRRLCIYYRLKSTGCRMSYSSCINVYISSHGFWSPGARLLNSSQSIYTKLEDCIYYRLKSTGCRVSYSSCINVYIVTRILEPGCQIT
jgi:hypothetical protein